MPFETDRKIKLVSDCESGGLAKSWIKWQAAQGRFGFVSKLLAWSGMEGSAIITTREVGQR